MARDGLLPDKLASVHPRYRTPHIVTMVTGLGTTIAAAVLPVGKLADYSNSGTLFAFMMVAIAVMVLRKTDPGRKRPFRTPGVFIVAPLTIIGCVGLYFSLPLTAILLLPIWGAIGLLVYFFYSRSHSHVGRGLESDTPDDPPGYGVTK
jgi:APA family basic amino acid/polyamine antiporter